MSYGARSNVQTRSMSLVIRLAFFSGTLYSSFDFVGSRPFWCNENKRCGAAVQHGQSDGEAGMSNMWSQIYNMVTGAEKREKPCAKCMGSETVPCPNCDESTLGYYKAYGRLVLCSCCKGRGFVLCRDCFRGDPYDIEAIRAKLDRKPN